MSLCARRSTSRLRHFSTLFPSIAREDLSLLFRHNKWRWLVNDQKQRALRSLTYDIEKLGRVVTHACGASHCVQLAKIEAGNNDMLIFKTDNKKELVARLPYGTAGPPRLTTQSEVATLDFLRNHVGLPVPNVVAWSDSTSEVGVEYIVYEKLHGEPFPDLDGLDSLSDADNLDGILKSIASMQAKLSQIQFSQFGSLYYKEHVSPDLQARPLYAPGILEDAASQRFRLGPSVSPIFYRGGRAKLDIERGPWPTVQDYIQSMANCELGWLKEYGDTEFGRNLAQDDAGRDVYKALLHAWFYTYTRHFQGDIAAVLKSPALLHPDLHSANILVNRDSDGKLALSGLLDWQSACIVPRYHLDDPPFLAPPPEHLLDFVKMPDDLTAMPETPAARASADEETRRVIDKELLRVTVPAKYRKLLGDKIGMDQASSINHPFLRALRTVEGTIPYMWNFGVFYFYRLWDLLEQTYGHLQSPPIESPFVHMGLDSEHLQRISQDAILVESIEKTLREALAEKGIVMGSDGGVDGFEYEVTTQVADEVYEAFLSQAQDEEDRARRQWLWPLREGRWSPSVETSV